ncbi:hypothetical protein KEM48_000812 [Puccinia striiformis f. sp. tritici PST-130]|nr:hypothetical protein KEM48_000812 [Puccinia striiformis f. sp. tritici PST-130]
MTWHKCGQPTATGAAGAQVKTVTGTLTYAIDHAVNVMGKLFLLLKKLQVKTFEQSLNLYTIMIICAGVRGTEPGVSGDHYYQCSLSQNPQRSRQCI